MNKYQESLIKEHSELIIRLDSLHNYIYNGEKSKSGHSVKDDNKVEFANKCIQLKGMKIYAEALEARLANAGIYFEDDMYLQNVANIISPSTEGQVGSDYDIDNKENEERNNTSNN